MMTLLAFMILTQPIKMDRQLSVPTTELAGVYTVKGKEKEPYVGAAVIHKLDKDVYHITNVVGPTVTKGYAIRKGNVLAVSWTNGTTHGLTVYEIHGRSLVGHWTFNGNLHEERIEWLGLVPE